jgi:oligopeptide/dipeptide ABC transporter ATP-binding protein
MTNSVRATSPPLLEVRGLTVEYNQGRRTLPLRAVDGVDLTIAARETVGVVGESGSGKSTIGRAILGLTPIKNGSITFAGADITNATHGERTALSSELQVVFQDPFSSLNPTRTIGQTLRETLRVNRHTTRDEASARAHEMLQRVGLPAEAGNRFPAQFSGGQRQRVAIARALMAQPSLVICDEAVSALDLSVQAQVLNLLRELQDEFQLSYLFIAHDLAVVRHVSHRIVVLYRGRVMEQGDAHTVYNMPAHPYSRALLDAGPVPDPTLQRARRQSRRSPQTDTVAQVPANACPFSTRCPHVIDRCRSEQPLLEQTPQGSLVACHRWRDLPANHEQGLQLRARPH